MMRMSCGPILYSLGGRLIAGATLVKVGPVGADEKDGPLGAAAKLELVTRAIPTTANIPRSVFIDQNSPLRIESRTICETWSHRCWFLQLSCTNFSMQIV